MSDKRRKARIQGGWATKRNKAPLLKEKTGGESCKKGEDMTELGRDFQGESSHQFTFKPTIKVIL